MKLYVFQPDEIKVPIKPKAKKAYDFDREFYSTDEWRNRRFEILERDEWMCRDCSKHYHERGAILQVHHINHKTHDLRDENLITLCLGCHNGKHNEKFLPGGSRYKLNVTKRYVKQKTHKDIGKNTDDSNLQRLEWYVEDFKSCNGFYPAGWVLKGKFKQKDIKKYYKKIFR
jgi:hypothetical protein